jgi:septum formation protein
MLMHFVYLASQSPRRSQLLDQMGVPHRLLLADGAEDVEALEVALQAESPRNYVQRVTGSKLNAALNRLQQRGLEHAPVLCADTTVALGRRILGKPKDEQDAVETLNLLSGRTHQVLTAVAIQYGPHRLSALSFSEVQFAHLSSQWIAEYVASGEPFGKAGAYAIQGKAAMGIARIAGSQSGIMGLPVFETAQLIAEMRTLIEKAG